ncbi:S9 family peptidase [Bryobacter aggregatus]|uniref:S9 family peptidase n=1 Tax=Bryobacter aggregatus TaxID=360054 RepID=UPI0004E0F096|nr:S9 family peptidase [Bryobacter aggregatus]
MRAILLGLSFAFCSWAATGLGPDTLWDWRNVAAPKISPDGSKIVYQIEWADRMTDAFHSNLWMVHADGSGNRPLTQGKQRDTGVVWSPDGKRIAYLSTKSGRPQIVVRWMENGDEAQITNLETAPSDLSWSPDSQWIAYFSRVPVKAKWSVKSTPPPPGATWTAGPSVVTKLKWRQDGIAGAGLVPESVGHLFVIAADGGAARQVTSGDYQHSGPASWTPDGKTVVLSAARREDADAVLYPEDLYAIDIATGNARVLVQRNGPEISAVVSPDGKWIAFLGFEDRGNSHHSNRLWVVGIDGKGLQLLGASLERDSVSPVWKPDSSGVYAVVESSGESHLYLAALKGGIEKLTSGTQRFSTGYAVADRFSIAKNGTVAITSSGPLEPKDVYAIVRGAAPLRLTQVNEGLMAGHSIGKTEALHWKSFDGQPIQGWVIYPPDFDAGKKYPLILDIHGGPHAMYGVEFQHQMQMFASRGFVVLYANPRGSTGYGEVFGNVIHAKYPGDDYQDLMLGVDAIVAKGSIDPKRLYVTGGSGGGLLTAWIVTKTDRFAAAVSQYPVSNWFTQTGSADIGLLMTRWMKAMPWANPQQYIERSPVFFADKIKTPTMVLTGEEDWRTPIAQSEELYFAMKVRGVDTVLVRFPKEPHGIRGAFPSHRILKVEHILGWFERHSP